MIIKRAVVFVILFFLITFLSACTGNPQQTNIGGVDIGFIQGAPPSEIEIGKPFNVGLSLYNSGSDETIVNVCIWDSLPDEYRGIPSDWSNCQNKQIFRDERVPIDFFGFSYENLEYNEYYVTIKARATYDYETMFSPEIYLDASEQYIGRENKQHISGGALKPDGKSPISVSAVDLSLFHFFGDTLGAELLVTLHKAPNGIVTSEEIDITIKTPNGVFFTCTEAKGNKKEIIELNRIPWNDEKETEKVINCDTSIPVSSGKEYKQVLNIGLEYQYSVEISTSIDVKKQGYVGEENYFE